MFALADVVHLLLDEFTRLRAGSLALALVPPSPLHCLFLWHACLLLRRHSPAHRRSGASLAGRPCNACVTPFCAGIRLLTLVEDSHQPPPIAIAGELTRASVVSYARAHHAGVGLFRNDL
jgi:hypothetical protein